MDLMELWGAYCARQGLSFETFCAGCDAMCADRELWQRRGFRELWEHVSR